MRRFIIAATVLALATSLTACGSGRGAATRNITQVTDGVEKTISTNESKIKIVNFLLVATEDGSAVVVGSIINQGAVDDELLGIAVGSSPATYSGLTTLKQNQPIRFEGESANAKAVFLGAEAKAGRHVTVTLGFARAGIVTVEAIIRDQRDDYAGIETGLTLVEGETPTASATPAE
jgi:hypothetical protein